MVLRDFAYEYTIIAAMRMGFKPFCILGNVFAVMHAPLTLISPGSCVYIYIYRERDIERDLDTGDGLN